MRKLFFTTAMFITCTCANAQADTIKSFAGLPALSFETAAFKTDDTAAINNWFKHFAAIEVSHIDSVINHTAILDSGVLVWLLGFKAMCQFINEDWNNLSYADTVFRNKQ